MKALLLSIGISLATTLSACSNPGTAPTPTPTPQAPLPDVDSFISKMVTQDGAKDSTANMQLIIEGKGEMRFQVDRKYDVTGRATLLRVTSPPEESEKTLLAFERPDQATTVMSYLPGLKKVMSKTSDASRRFR